MTQPTVKTMGLRRPMPPRDPNEGHRAATPLELLFDLVSVIAIATAAAGLHHAIADGHALDGAIRFALAFFAIWWAWMNYTWFASAYDNDDAVFRILTMVIMAGALTMASGTGALIKSLDITLAIAGYVIMRLAMICLWLRAARHDPAHRKTAQSYAIGIAVAQLYWASFLILPALSEGQFYIFFLIGIAVELCVPVFAERRGTTSWHRHHMIERYGLLTIIVLGETLLSGSFALAEASGGHYGFEMVHIALSALITVFCLWWLYFGKEEHLETDDLKRALTWGYGHVLIFASGAAVGAGFAVLIDIVTHHAKADLTTGLCAVAVPVALFLIGLWFVRDRFAHKGLSSLILPIGAALILLVPFTPLSLDGIAILCVACVIAKAKLPAQS